MTTPDIPEPKLNTQLVRTNDDTGKEITKETVNPFGEVVFQERINTWIYASNTLDSTLRSIYNIVWVLCSKLIQNKLLASRNFDKMDLDSDVVLLLKDIHDSLAI